MKTNLSLSILALLVTACGATMPSSDLNRNEYNGAYYSKRMTLNDPVFDHNLLKMCDGAKCEQYKKTDPAMYVFPDAGEGCILQTPMMSLDSNDLHVAYIDFDLHSVSPKIIRYVEQFAQASGNRIRHAAVHENPEMKFTVELAYRTSRGIEIADSKEFKVNVGFGSEKWSTFGRRKVNLNAKKGLKLKNMVMRICLDKDRTINASAEPPAGEGPGIHAWMWNDGKYPNVNHVMDMRRGERIIKGSNQLFVFAIYEAFIQYK